MGRCVWVRGRGFGIWSLGRRGIRGRWWRPCKGVRSRFGLGEGNRAGAIIVGSNYLLHLGGDGGGGGGGGSIMRGFEILGTLVN